MMALWRGRLPLARAFWEYAVLYSTIASMAATAAAFAALAADFPATVAIALHVLPVPYYAIAVVGVWRSAEAYAGPPLRARWARIAVVIWISLMIIV